MKRSAIRVKSPRSPSCSGQKYTDAGCAGIVPDFALLHPGYEHLAGVSAVASFEQPQFGRSRCIGAVPGSTHEKAYCCSGGIFDACSDGSIGPGTRRGRCLGSLVGSSGVRPDRGGCGRIGWIYGWTIHCSFLGIERIRPARQPITGENPHSCSSSRKPSNRPKWTCAISKPFAAAGPGTGRAGACRGANSPTSPNA